MRGDVVLARYNRELIVKRVVGLPGEEVALKQGQLYINGRAMAEEQPLEPGGLAISRGRLLEGKFALLGDNRSLGTYTTVHAVVSKAEIIGKVAWTLHLRGKSSSVAEL
jgi:signal peptidase I